MYKVLILFILIPYMLFSQQDSLFVHAEKVRQEKNLDEALKIYNQIIQNSKKNNDNKSLVKAYIETSNILSNQFKNKESLQFLNTASEHIENVNDIDLEIKLLTEYARNFGVLGFDQKAIDYYTKAINLCSKIKEVKKKNSLLQYLYGCRAVLYEDNKDFKLCFNDLKKADSISPAPFTASRLAKYYIVHSKNLDSAFYYLQKGDELFQAKKYPDYQKAILLRSYGRFYFEKKQYQKAIDYYEQSLSILKKEDRKKDVRDGYKLLYEAYKATENNKEATKYLEKYTALNDSLQYYHNNTVDISMNKFLKEKEVEAEKTKVNFYYLIAVLLILVAFLLIFFNKTKNKKQQQLEEKESIISQKVEETQILQLKVNESFEEIIMLAKNNSPEFWGRFQEVYPEFRGKLLALNSDLKPSELILNAYIYLGFNTKDIAEYTFKAVKTIKNNKYNLRKRLDIPTKSDFTVWLREIVD